MLDKLAQISETLLPGILFVYMCFAVGVAVGFIWGQLFLR